MDRSRRRAVATLAILILFWLAWDQVSAYRLAVTRPTLEHAPDFHVELTTASQAELRLLPNVGEKTSQKWVEHRMQPSFSEPTSAFELEALPHVGPKRATQLAPHLLETQAASLP